MIAFYRNGATLVKAYDDGDDIRIVYPNGEFWFSNWQADPRAALVRAFTVTCERLGVALNPDDILFTNAA